MLGSVSHLSEKFNFQNNAGQKKNGTQINIFFSVRTNDVSHTEGNNRRKTSKQIKKIYI